MNNKNKILVGCLALLLVLSVGYALFSETITINGTATAKGSFDMVATCQTGFLDKLGTPSLYGFSSDKDGGYSNDSCTVVGDEVLLNTDFLYPGASRFFTVKITNNGTIPAGFKQNDITVSKKLCVADNIEGNNQKCSVSTELNVNTSNEGYFGIMKLRLSVLEDSEGNVLSQSETLEYWDPVNLEGFLKPGYSIYVPIVLKIEHTPLYNWSAEMYVEFTASFKYPFTQYTE